MRCPSVGQLVMFAFAATVTHGCTTASPSPATPLVAPILNVQTTRYTGGLTPEHRRIAEQVHAAMAPRYREVCPAPDPNDPVTIMLGDDGAQAPRRPSLRWVDPDLASLIRALDDPKQEVRDVAAYTIGLLGPSAKTAEPFLRAKFAARDIKGGWYGFAREQVTCTRVFAADFRRAIPDDVLPPREPFGPFVEGSARVMAELYLDETLTFPPGLMTYAYSVYGIGPAARRTDVSLTLGRILENERLGRQKHLEAVEALIAIGFDGARPALPMLIGVKDTSDKELRTLVTQALLDAGSEDALPGLIERINDDTTWPRWKDDVCWYGSAAISAEAALINVARHATFAQARYDAVDALACIGSRNAVSALTAMLDLPDWQLNEKAAAVLRQIGDSNPAVIAALTKLYETHWSVRVRKAAWESLSAFGVQRPEPRFFYAPEPPPVQAPSTDPDEIPETVLISIGGPLHIDHGLPWCDPHARYSIDGTTWFPVNWKVSVLERVPSTFRGRDYLQGIGTQAFLRVGDGWLFGSVGFEGQGFFIYASDSGAVTNLIEPGASIAAIFRFRGKYFAIGSEPRGGDPAGLIEITRSADGRWSGRTLLTLPGSAFAYAVAPTGELLLGDGPNGIAIVDGKIVALKCEAAFPQSFFSEQRY